MNVCSAPQYTFCITSLVLPTAKFNFFNSFQLVRSGSPSCPNLFEPQPNTYWPTLIIYDVTCNKNKMIFTCSHYLHIFTNLFHICVSFTPCVQSTLVSLRLFHISNWYVNNSIIIQRFIFYSARFFELTFYYIAHFNF